MPSFPPWHFREMDRGEINVDPTHDEFFKAQDLADALVREAIQNSLDARRGNSRVHVRFRFATDDQALPADVAAKYLSGLAAHLPAGTELSAGSMPYLLVEDAGTRGLMGDPGEDPELDETPGARNDFYYFWRNVGRSGKGELDRGRWGLGKAVFSVASRVRAIFGLTHRSDDNRRLLLGQAVLKTHIVDGHRHAPYGFFADVTADSFPHAIEDPTLIEDFTRDFAVRRSEPGLSIVVPYPRLEDLQFGRIVLSVLRQYFYPIVRSDLEVTVAHNGLQETISNKTIDTMAEKYGAGAALAPLFALTRASVLLQQEERIALPDPAPGAPKWRDNSLPPSLLEVLRARFESGDLLAFRVALPVRRRTGRASRPSHFDVLVQKDESLRRGEHHFIRRGITIPEVKSHRDKPVRALLIADDEALSTFLGDAENPAHSDWSERNDKIRTLYDKGRDTLRYVKQAIPHLAALLSIPPAGRRMDLLADILSVSVPTNDDDAGRGADGPAPGAGESARSGEVSLAPKPSEGRLRLLPLAGGFTLRGNGRSADVGVPLTVEIAYRTRNGNPFRKHSAHDFDLAGAELTLAAEGAGTRTLAANRLEITPAQPDFELSVTGFDQRRDLVVRATRKDEDAPEAELH